MHLLSEFGLTARDKAQDLANANRKQRNAYILASVLTVFLVVASVSGLSAWHQYQKANTLLSDLHENINFMSNDLHDILIAYAPIDKQEILNQQVSVISEKLDGYISESNESLEIKAMSLKNKADHLLDKVGEDWHSASELYIQASKLLERVIEQGEYTENTIINLSILYSSISNAYRMEENSVKRMEFYLKNKEYIRYWREIFPSSDDIKILHCELLNEHTTYYSDDINAENIFLESIDTCKSFRDKPYKYSYVVADSYKELALFSASKSNEADFNKYYKEALIILENSSLKDPSNKNIKRELSAKKSIFGFFVLSFNDSKPSLESSKLIIQAKEIASELYYSDKSNMRDSSTYQMSLVSLGNFYYANEEYEESLENFKELEFVTIEMIENQRIDITNIEYLHLAYSSIGTIYEDVENPSMAKYFYQKSIDIFKNKSDLYSENSLYNFTVSILSLAEINLEEKHFLESRSNYLEVMENLNKLISSGSENSNQLSSGEIYYVYQDYLASTYLGLAEIDKNMGNNASSIEYLNKYIEAIKNLPDDYFEPGDKELRISDAQASLDELIEE